MQKSMQKGEEEMREELSLNSGTWEHYWVIGWTLRRDLNWSYLGCSTEIDLHATKEDTSLATFLCFF